MKSIENIIKALEKYNIKFKISYGKVQTFDTFCPLNNLCSNAVTWARNIESISEEKRLLLRNNILFIEYDQNVELDGVTVIRVDHVHRSFFRVIEDLFEDQNLDSPIPMIENTAVVETTKIGKNVYIGHHTYIGRDVVIGDDVKIFHNVVLEGKVTIGEKTIVESGATIGVCGFGPVWNEYGRPDIVPHLGGVVVGKCVRIGANTAIARGCLGNTIIEDYVKIDNLVHIAHNDIIKSGAMITAGAIVAGSSTIGENVWIAPGAIVNESLNVNENSLLGVGTIVLKDVLPNKVMIGNPSRELRSIKKNDVNEDN